MITLSLRGVPVYCSAVTGHFVLAHRCDVRLLHTVAGKWRVSTVGRFRSMLNHQEFYDTIGSGRYGETFVWPVEGCTEEIPEGESIGYTIAERGYAANDSRVIEAGHLAILDAVCALVAAGADTPETIAAAVASLP
jgi:hypothetical protein